jgi:hypothetical protein
MQNLDMVVGMVLVWCSLILVAFWEWTRSTSRLDLQWDSELMGTISGRLV